MLKLINFPGGSKKNCLLQECQQEIYDDEKPLSKETSMVFFRFWKEYNLSMKRRHYKEQKHENEAIKRQETSL